MSSSLQSIPLIAHTSPSDICDRQVIKCRVEGGLPLLPCNFSAMVMPDQANWGFPHYGGKVDMNLRTNVSALSIQDQKQ